MDWRLLWRSSPRPPRLLQEVLNVKLILVSFRVQQNQQLGSKRLDSTDYTKPHPHFSIHNMASIHYSEQRCTFPVLMTSLQHLTDGIHNLRFRQDDTKTASLLPIRLKRPRDFQMTAPTQIWLKIQHCILRGKKSKKKLHFKLFVPEM